MATCPSCGTENPDRAKFCMECTAPLGSVLALGEERKVVTIVFCDLVMFTARAETLDPEDVRAFLVPYYDVLTEEITRHGGVVDKFLGDGVMAVFGAPVAHEDDPERAVRTALKMLERIPELGLDLHARVGITTGEVMVVPDPAGRGDAITGDAANTASRLQALAPVDGVVVGETTYRATAHLFDYEVLEPAQVKGKAEPVPIYRPLAPIARPSSDLVPDATPFVGRDFELESLVRLFDRSRTGPSTEFVTVVADPGIGKSRLVRELARHVESLPELITWRQGRCLPYGDGISFWALGEIIKAHAGIFDTDDQRTLSSKLDAVLVEPDESLRTWMRSRIAPLVGLETTTQPPQQEEAFTAWRRFLEQIAERGPTVLVVEDLHWADDALVAFLQHLAERTSGLPILVVTTARPELEERHPTWLGRARRSTVLPLTALADRDMTTLVRATLEGASPELISTVLERAGGSPLYAEQLAAMLRDQQLPIAGGSLDESVIPPSIQALLAARIDALTPELKATLLDASVVGKTFWSGAVSALGEHPDLEDHLAELARRDFIRPAFPSSMEGELEFSFVHALVRDVAYGELPRTARAKRHMAVGAWLEAAGDGRSIDAVELLAAHYLAAARLAGAIGDAGSLAASTPKAIAWLRTAGVRLTEVSPAKAASLLEQALQLTQEGDPGRSEILARYGEAQLGCGRFDAADAALRVAVEALKREGDLPAAARAMTRRSTALHHLGVAGHGSLDREAVTLLEPAGPSPALADAWAELGDVLHAEGDLEGSLDALDNAVSVAMSCGVPTPSKLPLVRVMVMLDRGDADAMQVLRASQDSIDDLDFLWGMATIAGYFEGSGALLETIERLQRLASSRGDDALASGLDVERASWRAARGEMDGLAAEVDRIRAKAADDLTYSQGVRLDMLRADLLLLAGRNDEASAIAADALERARGSGFGYRIVGAAMCFLATRDAIGDGVSVRRLLNEIDVAASNRLWTFFVERLPATVRVALRNDETGLAASLCEGVRTEIPFHRHAVTSCRAAVAASRFDHETARALYGAAVDGWQALEIRTEEAHALAGLGRCLLGVGETEEGVARLNEARELWVGMKATPRIAEIDELLATVG